MNLPITEPPTRNKKNGRFLKNHKPHNKGKSWSEWMDGRKKRKVLKNLELGRVGNPNIAGSNAKKIVGIKNGKFVVFPNSEEAGRILDITARNIRHACHKKRKSAGGWKWYFENDPEWIKSIEK